MQAETIYTGDIECLRTSVLDASSIRPQTRFEIEIIDQARFDSLNEQLGALNADEPPDEDEEAHRLWCAKRRPLVEALEETIRMGGRYSL